MRYHGNSDVLSRTPGRDGYARWENLWAATPAPQRTDALLFLDAPAHTLTLDFPAAAADYGFARLRYDAFTVTRRMVLRK
jgi:hypothetical protein